MQAMSWPVPHMTQCREPFSQKRLLYPHCLLAAVWTCGSAARSALAAWGIHTMVRPSAAPAKQVINACIFISMFLDVFFEPMLVE
jgi:hypothetical protein